LLSIKSNSRRRRFLSISVEDAPDISSSSDGTAAARSSISATAPLYSTNLTSRVYSYMRSIDDKTGSAVRDVSCHGAKAGFSSERESSKAAHIKVFVKCAREISLQRTVNFITAKRSCNLSFLPVVSLIIKSFSDQVYQLDIGESAGKGRSYFREWSFD